ncbi:alpha/beta hydrolase family protein [Austwickia chelonae]|uniref:alpha/beta hydrolase family protein n=1 Tax=Austwickia chelonae TaxID=100225 RepID=UPI000E284030|nr:prolyl oligopeptidase family serine peptidase [Austwickia chelonae]
MPYGTWPSPVIPADVAASEALVEWVDFVGPQVFWVEVSPEDDGRAVLMRAGDDGPEQVLAPEWNVRTKVIEYGGRPWAPCSRDADDGIVFSHGADHRVYRWQPGLEPIALSPTAEEPDVYRHADFRVADGFVWCLREQMADDAGQVVYRQIVRMPLDGSAAENSSLVQVMAATHHFLTGPSLNANGTKAAWIGWDHPHMPWEQTEVWTSEAGDEGWSRPRKIEGLIEESITQVTWDATDGDALLLLSDRSGWWLPYVTDTYTSPRALVQREEEFGEALWRVGQRWMAPLTDGRIATSHGTSGRNLALLGKDGHLAELAVLGYTEWIDIASDGSTVAVIAHGPQRRRSVLTIDTSTGTVNVVRPPVERHDAFASTPYLHVARLVDGTCVPAHVYPPHHPAVDGPPGPAPYVVVAHGGPSNRSSMVMNQEFTFFTSRGIGVVDVQYGGSTGFGRDYRNRLTHSWGVVDVNDCAAVARDLIDHGVIDPARIAIRGGSAGGWTAVASLTTHPDLYRAAGIYYPVIEPESFRNGGTHDFESHYLESLVGAWPEEAERYRELSPIRRAERISAPFVLLQGLDDTVCPPAQAQQLLDRVDSSAAPYDYLTLCWRGTRVPAGRHDRAVP